MMDTLLAFITRSTYNLNDTIGNESTRMISYIEMHPAAELLDKESKALGGSIIRSIAAETTSLQLERGTDLFSCVKDGLVYIDKGIFKYYHRNKMVRLYETGDLLFTAPLAVNAECRCSSEFGAAVHLFDNKKLTAHFTAHPGDAPLFLRYFALQSALMHLLCAAYTTDDLRPDFSIKKFDPGTVIISEGAPALEIYQMIQGIAVVTVNKVQVGKVEAGEVFGEISFFTGSTRSATVTAETECIVQIMGKDDFITLASLKPSVNFAISKTLSERLVATNKKISG